MNYIVFDVDDTLYDMMTPFTHAFHRLFGASHADIDLTRLFVLSRKYSDEVFEATVNGTMSMEAMYIYRIKQSCRDMGIEISDEEGLRFQHFYEEGQRQLEMPKVICELLTMLKSRGYELGIITNGPSAHQWRKIEALGVLQWIPKENILVSGDCDYAKPDSRIYQLMAKRLSAEPEDCLYIGDSFENDIWASKMAGWKAVWINKRNVENEMAVEPDYMVKNNRELFTLLEKIL